ncbi:MAG: type II toxin-antitoxin system ParD family antitoxin [Vulcanimicrobiaceae bacterium]
MTISIPPEMDAFVRSQVESGRYASSSEVIRAGLRLLQDQEHEREVRRDALRAWIDEALAETDEPTLSEEEVLERVRQRLARVRRKTGSAA